MKLCLLVLICAISISSETSEEEWELLMKTVTDLTEEVKMLKDSFTEAQLNVTSEFDATVASYVDRNMERILTELQPLKKMNDLEELTRSTCSRIQVDDLRRLIRSANPQCRSGWVTDSDNKKCYFFSPSQAKVDWDTGRQRCLDMGADYVKITTKTKYDFIRDKLTPPDHFWIGLHDSVEDGTYRWISDGSEEPIIESWWLRGEPNNFGGWEHCVSFKFMPPGTYGWNDWHCKKTELRFICESNAK